MRASIVLFVLVFSAFAHAANDYALYLPFNGSLVDASPNMNNGTATGACSYAAGETGQALALDGTSCFVEFKSVIVNQANWTWQAWVYPTTDGEIYGEGSPGVTFQIVRLGADTLAVEIWNISYPGNWIGVNTAGLLPANQWTLVTLTLEGGGVGVGTLKIYINGSFVTQAPSQAESSTNSIYAGVGDNPGDHGAMQPADYFGGKLEQLQIFQRALAPSEICAAPNKLCGTTCVPSTSCCTAADCPGPSAGAGIPVCSGVGGTCSIVCGDGEALCNGACIGATQCCDGACLPNTCLQNSSCNQSGVCMGDAVPDGTPCELAGCPYVSSCMSAACTCQAPADLGTTVSTPDGGSSVKRGHGCAIAGVAERTAGSNVSLLLLIFFVAMVGLRTQAFEPRARTSELQVRTP